MRVVFYNIGILAVGCGISLVIATALAKFTPISGYSAGISIAMGGTICLLAGVKNYRGHWSFVTGVALSTLALAAFGGEIDSVLSTRGTRAGMAFGVFLAFVFLSFGLLSIWSGHKLHRCTLKLERTEITAIAGRAICAECKGAFGTADLISFGDLHVCARCKPIFLQKLTEGAEIVTTSVSEKKTSISNETR